MAKMRFIMVMLAGLAACSHQRAPEAKPAPTLPVQPRRAPVDDDVLPLGKLPVDVAPTAYTLTLTIDPVRDDFSGDVAIHVALTAPREYLWLHGQGLRVKRAQATLADGTVIKATYEQMTPDGLARLSFGQTVQPQQITIAIAYDASYSKRLQGLYKVTVGEQPYVFAQFEAIAARQAFPCFDEPRFKTPFAISVIAPRFAQVVSTTHIAGEILDIVQKRVRFAETPPLPTYLLTFAVGDFDVVDNGPLPANAVRSAPLPFRGIAVKGYGPKLAYAMEHTGPILNELESYFATPYAFDKLDIIAVPDFSAGAMENVGAITFRDGLLLTDPHHISVDDKRAFAEVMAHELAHMWFGNVVTMTWWDDTWLNESFATWMGHRAKRVLDPSADLSRLRDVLAVMRLDSLAAAQPIHRPIEGSHDLATAFDAITYDKGLGVLTMFEQYVGDAAFRTAIQTYIARYRFANATADDLFAILDDVSGKQVSQAMRTFIDQPGVPLVEATVSCSGQPQLTLAQSRYLPLGSTGDAPRRWVIPVCGRYDGRAECWSLTEPEQTFTLASCPTWLMPNAGASGYYRFTTSRPPPLSELTRSEVVAAADNLRAAVSAGKASPVELLQALPVYAKAHDQYLDSEVADVLRGIYDHSLEPARKPQLDALTERALGDRVGAAWLQGRKGESDDEHVMRVRAVRLFARYSVRRALESDAAARGAALLAQLETNPEYHDVGTELGGVTIGSAIREHKVSQDAVIAVLGRAGDPTIRATLIGALASVRDRDQVAKTLALVPSLRASELWAIAMPLAHHPATRDQTWSWFTETFDAVKARVPDDTQGYLTGFGGGFCSDERAAEVQAFFEPRIDSMHGGRQGLAEIVEAIHLCAVRDREQRQAINEWLANKEQ